MSLLKQWTSQNNPKQPKTSQNDPKQTKKTLQNPKRQKTSQNDPQYSKRLNEDFASICDWFVDYKLSIHFGEDKTKLILFATKNKIRRVWNLNITYQEISIKQYSSVTYLGCIIDETLSGESMAFYVLNKLDTRLKFLYRKSEFLALALRRLLCNALI